jgi:hypothetical protein
MKSRFVERERLTADVGRESAVGIGTEIARPGLGTDAEQIPETDLRKDLRVDLVRRASQIDEAIAARRKCDRLDWARTANDAVYCAKATGPRRSGSVV